MFDPVITTNHKARGIYLPPDDARNYIAWTDRARADWGYNTDEELDEKYFKPLYAYFANGGYEQIAHYLQSYHLLTAFNPKTPPPKTDAWHQIVEAYADPKTSTVATILERLDNPPAVSIRMVRDADTDHELGWDSAPGRNTVAADMESAGYVAQRSASETGRWPVGSKANRSQVKIYVRADLSASDRKRAAQDVYEIERARAAKEDEKPPEQRQQERDARDFGG